MTGREKGVKESDRVSEFGELSDKGKSMVKYLEKNHPEIKIETDNSNSEGHLYGADKGNKIIVGTKNKAEIPQILLHEMSHAVIQDKVEGSETLVDYVKKLNKNYGKQLFSVSTSEKYDNAEKKSTEDVCELIALYARDDGNFDKYMKTLQSGENEKLAKISESDIQKLKYLCEKIVSNLSN